MKDKTQNKWKSNVFNKIFFVAEQKESGTTSEYCSFTADVYTYK